LLLFNKDAFVLFWEELIVVTWINKELVDLKKILAEEAGGYLNICNPMTADVARANKREGISTISKFKGLEAIRRCLGKGDRSGIEIKLQVSKGLVKALASAVELAIGLVNWLRPLSGVFKCRIASIENISVTK
jgi:hypothetical protein